MKAPKPGDKWVYKGGDYGKPGGIIVVRAVGEGCAYAGGPVSRRVWVVWEDGQTKECEWHHDDFLRKFRPCGCEEERYSTSCSGNSWLRGEVKRLADEGRELRGNRDSMQGTINKLLNQLEETECAECAEKDKRIRCVRGEIVSALRGAQRAVEDVRI